MLKEVISSLGRFGLKGMDAKVFVTLLHFKSGLYVHEIVTETKIKRSTVDLILQRLGDEGYVRSVRAGKRFKFFAERPEALLFRKEQAVNDFRHLLPLLGKLGGDKGETDIRFFEGADGLRDIYNDILMELKDAEGDARSLLSFSSGAHIMRLFPDMQKAFIRKRVALGAPYRAIAPRSSAKVAEWTNDDAHLRQVRYIDEKKFPFKSTFEIYAGSLMIYSPVRPVGGIVLRNRNVADSMRALFRLVWGLLGD